LRKTVVELREVKKNYSMGKVIVPALRGINLSIKEKEFVAVMGPSGSGKSTLMHLIGCLDIPTTGVITLDGQNISELSESKLAVIRGKKIGFVFQKFNLISSLTALENVVLPLVFQEVNRKERTRKAVELLEKVGLSERLEHKPNELSGGEQQRVAIARALAVDPQMLLADEPTGNLDSRSGREIIEIIKKLHEEGKTIVVVTHDESIARNAERIIKLKDGLIVGG